MLRLLESRQGSDMLFSIADCGVQVAAHSTVIAARCKSLHPKIILFLAENRTRPDRDRQILEIPVERASEITLRKVLGFIYAGTISLQSSDVFDVCLLAEQFGLDSLQKIAFAYLQEKDNIFLLAHVLDRVLESSACSARFVRQLTKVFAENCSQIFKTISIESMSKILMEHIVKQENLAVSECAIWDALICWSCHHCDMKTPKRVSAMTGMERQKVVEYMLPFCRPGYLRIVNFDTETFLNEVEPLGVFSSDEVLLKYRFDAAAGLVNFEHAFPQERYSFLSRMRQRTMTYESCMHPHQRGISLVQKVELPRWVSAAEISFDPRTQLGRYADLEFFEDEQRKVRIYSWRANQTSSYNHRFERQRTPFTNESNRKSVESFQISGFCFWFTFYAPQNVGDRG